MVEIGSKIRKLRSQREISQERFASDIGVSVQTISRWENNVNSPDLSMLPILAAYFKVTTDYMLGRSSCDLSPSTLLEPYIEGFLIQDVILMLKKLPYEHRQALVLLLEEISFGTSMRAQANQKGR